LNKKINGFDTEAYLGRLRLMREICSGENQADFAKRLGIPAKRWSNYERGYPVPRETAFLIIQKFPGMSVEWLWFGMMGNLAPFYRDKIAAAEQILREQSAALRAAEKVEAKLRELDARRKKSLHPSSPRRR
jgi:hypothetical protein